MGIQQFSTEFSVASSSPTTVTGTVFLLPVNAVSVINDGGTPIYLNIGSTAATTGDMEIKSNEPFSLDARYIDRLSVASTTTSTGDKVRVAGWRW